MPKCRQSNNLYPQASRAVPALTPLVDATALPLLRSRYAIFLPVRNGVLYLRQAIESITAQTVTDWRLYVLDNASTDGSAEIVAQLADPRIHIYRSGESLPIWESWHRIYELLAGGVVTAEYVTTIGHDDRLTPDFLATLDRLIAKQPNASLYQTPFDVIDEVGRLVRPSRPIPTLESAQDFVAARMWGLRDSAGTGFVFRPRDYVAVGGMPRLPLLLYSDDLLFARLSAVTFKASAEEIRCSYRLHRRSTSHQLSRARIEAQIEAIEAYIALVTTEYPALEQTRTGRAAVACFIAREIMIIRPLARPWLMSNESCARVERLVALYTEVTEVADYRSWLGTNVVSRSLYPRFKQLMLFYLLSRENLASVFRRRRLGSA